MSRELHLLPYALHSEDSTSVLRCHPEGRLIAALDDLEEKRGQSVSASFCSYMNDEGFGPTQRTPCRDPLRFITARDLRALSSLWKASAIERNRAVGAYLDQLDDLTRVALYWV